MAERKRRLTDASDIAVIGHSILEEGMSSSAEIELNEEKKLGQLGSERAFSGKQAGQDEGWGSDTYGRAMLRLP